MAKNPPSANQDHYKVAGRSPQPNEHEVELQKREAKHDNSPAGEKAKPTIKPKDAEPGRKAHVGR